MTILKNIINNKALSLVMILMVALLLPVLMPNRATAAYGPSSETFIDPSIMKIDEDKFLGATVFTDYDLVDSDNNNITFKDFRGKPLVLVLSYYKCDGACPTINKELKDRFTGLKSLEAGKDYNILTVSFDLNDNQMSMMHFLKEVDIPEDMKKGWTTAIFKDPALIRNFTDSIGYRYFWSKRDKIFLHPSVYIVISPEGWVTRYLYSAFIENSDLELSILEARNNMSRENKIDDFKDLFLTACYSYNYKEGKYTLNYPVFISAASLLFGVSLIAGSLMIYKKKEEDKS